MKRSRRSLAVLGAVLVGAGTVAGCAGTDGLGPGERAPDVSVQPTPEAVWRAWAGSATAPPGAGTSAARTPPEALTGLPEVRDGRLGTLDVRAVLRADPRMRQLADRPEITGPGLPGLRPARYLDLTGDGRPELIVAVDTEGGRTVLGVYTAHDGRVYDVLVTGGRQLAVETLGTDLLLRSRGADGAEQAVRYHWDGVRLSTVSDEKKYGNSGPTPSPGHGAGGGA
ncbi:hypothetical protein ACIQAC_03845 [Streptomyces sp. NPDC088387]|uniref:hypothetical protein n=1 Tax=Streptomyces sp. NPDC088387 TaxID=3365859 RepID=UPI0038262A21